MRVGFIDGEADRRTDEIDASALRRLIVARRNWILLPTLLALVLSTVFVNVVKPRYMAEAKIVLENQRNFLPGSERTEQSVTQQLDAEAVGSQIQILTSRDLARKVIRAVGLQGNPEFDPLANGTGAVERMLVLLGLKRDPTRMSPEDRILESYFDRLTVLSPLKTRVLTVEFWSRDPDLSARIANTIADLYLEFQSDAKRDSARAAAESLAQQVNDLKARVATADAKAEAFRSQTGLLVGTNNTSINAQQLADVNTELARARTSQADAQAKANLLRDMLKQGRVADIPDVANNELVRRISEQRVTARAQLALESRTLLPGHPRIKELTAQVADFDSAIRAAGEKSARSLEAEAKVASARVDNLSHALDNQKKLIGASGTDEVQMRELDRAARALKDDLDGTTTRYQEALARETSRATPSDARIFSRALAPQNASFPKKLPIIAIATLAALVLSIGAVVARDFWFAGPNGVGSRLVTEPAAPLAAPSARADRISPAPAIPAPIAAATDAASTHAGSVQTGLADALRAIDAAGLPLGGMLAVMATEGSEAGLALALARELSRRGRVVFVAADRDVTVPTPDAPGLSDLLNGSADFAAAIHRDPQTRLHVVPSGTGIGAATGDLGAVLDALKGTYDAVVFGAPAAMGNEEAKAVTDRTNIALVGGADGEGLATLLTVAGVPHVVRMDGAGEPLAQAA